MQVKSLFLTLVWLCCLIQLSFARALAQPSKQEATALLHFTKNIGHITDQHLKVRTDLDSRIGPDKDLIQYQATQQTSHHPNELPYGGASMLSLQENGSLRSISPMRCIGEHASWVYTQEGRAIGSRFVFIPNIICHV